jgi:toxin YoeB
MVYFTKIAENEYADWRKDNKKLFSKINDLIDDILKNGVLIGIGKPERLKYYSDPPRYSRRISPAHRLVYSKLGENDILILSCKDHYE